LCVSFSLTFFFFFSFSRYLSIPSSLVLTSFSLIASISSPSFCLFCYNQSTYHIIIFFLIYLTILNINPQLHLCMIYPSFIAPHPPHFSGTNPRIPEPEHAHPESFPVTCTRTGWREASRRIPQGASLFSRIEMKR
jgi:hypothetical protein